MHTLKDKEFAALGAALSRIPSPCYVLQESKLLENLALIDRVRKEAGVEIIVALKASAIDQNGNITVKLTTAGTYTFCVQYDDESYNYYIITVD